MAHVNAASPSPVLFDQICSIKPIQGLTQVSCNILVCFLSIFFSFR